MIDSYGSRVEMRHGNACLEMQAGNQLIKVLVCRAKEFGFHPNGK